MKIALAADHAHLDLQDDVGGLGELEQFGRDLQVLVQRRVGGSLQLEGSNVGRGGGIQLGGVLEEPDRGQSGACDRAILCCGTGIGMAVAANKFKGLRATPCWTPFTADVSRRHNDSNCLAVGGRTLTLDEGLAIVRVWLETPFAGGRHARRVDEIRAYENRHIQP